MRAMVAVTAYHSGVPDSGNRLYELRAECHRGIANGSASRQTTVTRKQNE
jgi:hypothetical protein